MVLKPRARSSTTTSRETRWIVPKSERTSNWRWIVLMRQKVFVKVPLRQGVKEQGRLHDMRWVNIKERESEKPIGGTTDQSAKDRTRICLHVCLR